MSLIATGDGNIIMDDLEASTFKSELKFKQASERNMNSNHGDRQQKQLTPLSREIYDPWRHN
jgi:hypothetical protein